MKIDRHIAYNLKGATSKQRKEFLKLILTDNPKGWNEDAQERFLLEDEDFVYWDEIGDSWEWNDFDESESEKVVFVREFALLKIKEIQYTDSSGKVTILRGDFEYYFSEDKLIVCNTGQE